MPLIDCQNITLKYESRTVLSNLSFQVTEGDYLCIVGENGSGKTTLMKALLGLKAPAGGKILLGDGLRQSEIGYLPQQDTGRRNFPASVYEIVLSGCLNKKGLLPFYSSSDRKKALLNLERLAVSDLKNRCFMDLSGGQQQRVLLARALSATAKLLVLDEPVTGLDPLAAGEFYDLTKRLNQDLKITVIMVSHDIHSSLHNASHILHLHVGSAFFGTVAEYLDSDIGRNYIGDQGRCAQCLRNF